MALTTEERDDFCRTFYDVVTGDEVDPKRRVTPNEAARYVQRLQQLFAQGMSKDEALQELHLYRVSLN
jgi:hypothetical protein